MNGIAVTVAVSMHGGVAAVGVVSRAVHGDGSKISSGSRSSSGWYLVVVTMVVVVAVHGGGSSRSSGGW